MSVHVDHVHHRPTVKRNRLGWVARCNDCGFRTGTARWRDAFRVALRHADGSLR